MRPSISFQPLRYSPHSHSKFSKQTACRPSIHPCKRPTRKPWLANRQAARMAVAPDDTALDMLSFALSGPGIFASFGFLGGLGAFLLSFAEIGPRRPTRTGAPTILLRVRIGASMRIELATGGVRVLRQGESVLRFVSREECTAAVRQLEAVAVRQNCSLEYAVYRAGPGGISELTRYPATRQVKEARWQSVDVVDGVSEKERILYEYERAGTDSDIDREWARVADALTPIRFNDRKSTCKLCAGAGHRRCARCGGASMPGGTFVCDCESGRVQCEWCKGSGQAE